MHRTFRQNQKNSIMSLNADIIKRELYNSFKSLRKVKINYEFNSLINTHIVEVLPLKSFNSKKYIDLEILFEKKAEELFPEEEFVFVSSDSLTRVHNPVLIHDSTLLDFAKISYSIKQEQTFGFKNVNVFDNLNECSTNYLAA